jgi:hypothetical protein
MLKRTRRQMTKPLILDSTYIDDADIFPPAVPGTRRSLMLGSVISPNATWPNARSVLAVAAKYASLNPQSLCFDLEIPGYDLLAGEVTPQQLHDLIAPVAIKYPVTCFYPPALAKFDDNKLKTNPSWTPRLDDPIMPAAQNWATGNAIWIKLLWGVGFCGYFGDPANDATTLNLIANLTRLAKFLFPRRPVIATLSIERDESWYAPGGVISDSLCAQTAAVVKAEGIIPQVWGKRALALPLFKALGGAESVAAIEGAP